MRVYFFARSSGTIKFASLIDSTIVIWESAVCFNKIVSSSYEVQTHKSCAVS